MGDESIAIESDQCCDTHAARNHRLGVLSGTLGQVGIAFLHPELILAGLVFALTGSNYLVALIATISKAGALAPQLLVGGFVEHKPRKMPSYVALIVMRALAYAALIGSMWMMTRGMLGAGLAIFFASYLVVCALGGATHVVSMDLVGRMIPHHRVGRFLGLRSFLGGVLAGVAALLIVQPVLERGEFPMNYLVLAATGASAALTAMIVFARARERDGPTARHPTTFAESLRRGFRWLREDHNYRCYFLLRVAFRVNYLSLAFFIPYGKERLADARSVVVLGGIMVAIWTWSRVLAAWVWGKVIDRYGYRLVMTFAGLGFFLSPLLALIAPTLPVAFEIALPGTKTAINLPLCVYFIALAAVGMTHQASVFGGQQFLIRESPPHRRVSYWGFLNTVTSPLTVLPFAGAWIAERFGMVTLFVICVCGGFFYLVVALRMKPPASRAL